MLVYNNFEQRSPEWYQIGEGKITASPILNILGKDTLQTTKDAIENLAMVLTRTVGDRFDIVYCYGLLSHVPDPGLAIGQLAGRYQDLLLLETAVSLGDAAGMRNVEEAAEAPTQAVTGRGVRPTRPWLFAQLKQHFAHVYVPATQPAHEEFPLDWTAPAVPGIEYQRPVFVASRRPIANPLLLERLPERQTAV